MRSYTRLLTYINKTLESQSTSIFAELSGEALREFNVVLNEINVRNPRPITFDEANSIRHSILITKSIRAANRIRSGINAIARMYENGRDILTLSNIYKCPPVMLLREILAVKGVRYLNSDQLNERDREELRLASLNDEESKLNQQKRAEIANENETKFVNWCLQLGIKLKTQEELADEQIKEFGEARLTPDVLFIEPVIINGSKCAWIDYKDYTGVPDGVLYKSNVKQVKKYSDKWGPGAMIYRLSFVDDTLFPNAITLSTNLIPL